MSKINYCLPILASTQDEVLLKIEQNLDNYQYFEVWIDYVDKPGVNFIKQLVELLGDRLVMVFRRQNLDSMHMNSEQRLAIIRQLESSAVLVDLDIDNQKLELEYIRVNHLDIKILASYHNYQMTPDTVQLRSIIATMAMYQPSIYKLATFCKQETEAVRLLDFLLKLKDEGLICIILGSGQAGKITRIFGTLWGNEMIFAPTNISEQTDQGQLTRAELETIFNNLKE